MNAVIEGEKLKEAIIKIEKDNMYIDRSNKIVGFF